jgi:uncharacterized membrane protein
MEPPIRTAILLTLLVATLAATLFATLPSVAPLLDDEGLRAGTYIRLAYLPLCHQIPDRCLHIGPGPIAVCARCQGLYLGGVLGLWLATATSGRIRLRPVWLFITVSPHLVDLALGLVGLPNAANWPRLAMAIPTGLVCGLLLAEGIVDLVRMGLERKTLPRFEGGFE